MRCRRSIFCIDEAHHAVADSYRRIIDRTLQRNPSTKIFGVTATPNRGDKKGLRQVFSNVCDQIRIAELIASVISSSRAPSSLMSACRTPSRMCGASPPTSTWRRSTQS